EIGDARSSVTVGAGSSLERHRERRERIATGLPEHAIGDQAVEIRADPLQERGVDKAGRAAGAVYIELEDRTAIYRRGLHEVIDVGGRYEGGGVEDDLLREEESVEVSDRYRVARSEEELEPIASRAADPGIRARPVPQRVVAGAAQQQIIPTTGEYDVAAAQAAENTAAAIAADEVIQVVAGTVDVRAAQKDELLDIGAEGVGDPALHCVEIGRRTALHYLVADIVDLISVAAGATHHAVGAGAAIQSI